MTATTLPPLPTVEIVQERLLLIFPEGSPQRGYCTREMAAKTVFAMLYIGAVEGASRYAGPKHVYRMGDDQAALTSDAERVSYASDVMAKGYSARGATWYADNSRESIRDETLRNGLIAVGAVSERKGVPTTSGSPRYVLSESFARLFDPALVGAALEAAATAWRATHLSTGALARIKVVRAGATKDASAVIVTFPSGETRRLVPGPSAVITKAVIEEFATRFLETPAVLWVSESGNKVVARDDELAKSLELEIDPSKNLPDVILVDAAGDSVLLVFVEVVATDGPVTDSRRAELLKLTNEAGFDASSVAFVTAFMDRGHAALKKTLASVAWNSFVWLASEPEHIIALVGGNTASSPRLRALVTSQSN